MAGTSPRPVVLVRPEAETTSKQRLPYVVGISGQTRISMHLVVIL